MAAAIFLAVAFTLNALANVLIKYAMTRPLAPVVRLSGSLGSSAAPFLTWAFLAGIGCFAMNLVFYSLALRTLKLSLAYPLMVSLGYIVILALSWIFFGERLTAVQYTGIGLILIGVWLLVR